MRSTSRPTSSARAAALLALWSASVTFAFDAPYCSNQNTGSGDAFTWTFQSNGKCTDHCNGLGTFAFAVIQYTNCWCSNYIPADQGDTSECNVGCPGYPAENCGSKDKGLYIYIKMAGKPSGTQGDSQPSSTDRAPASPTVTTSVVTVEPSTVVMTVTGAAQVTTVFSSITSVSTLLTTESTQPSSTKRAPSSSAQSATTEKPRTSATVVTESGVIVTRTVVLTSASSSSDSKTKGSNSGTSIGAIVGGVVGGVIAFLAIIGGVLFFLWRKKKQQQEQLDGEGGQSGLNRNTSTMSKNGLLGGNRNERTTTYPPMAVATSGSQGSRHDSESIGPMSASDRRFSQPVMVDSRLNPRAVLTFHGSNENRDSLDSIDDSRDYGRKLNVVNPDPTRD